MKAFGIWTPKSGLLALVLDYDKIPFGRLKSLLTGWVGEMEIEIFPPGGSELQLVRSSIAVEYLLDEAGALGGVAVAKEEDLRVFAC